MSKTTGNLKAVMNDLSPDDWLIRADGLNRYIIVTPMKLSAAGRDRISELFWYGTDLEFRESDPIP